MKMKSLQKIFLSFFPLISKADRFIDTCTVAKKDWKSQHYYQAQKNFFSSDYMQKRVIKKDKSCFNINLTSKTNLCQMHQTSTSL